MFILYNSRDFSSVTLVHALANTISRDSPIKKLEEIEPNTNKLELFISKKAEINNETSKYNLGLKTNTNGIKGIKSNIFKRYIRDQKYSKGYLMPAF